MFRRFRVFLSDGTQRVVEAETADEARVLVQSVESERRFPPARVTAVAETEPRELGAGFPPRHHFKGR